MGWFDKLTGKTEAVAPVAAPVSLTLSQLVAELSDGVYHEYFVNDEAVNGLIAWHCRVYAKDGAPHEMSGSAPSREAAATEAQAWAADKKRELRGIA